MNRVLRNLTLTLATSLFIAACGGGGGGNNGGSSSGGSSSSSSSSSSSGSTSTFDYSALFANLADNIIIPNYESFNTSLATASTSVSNWCGAIGSEDEAAGLASAQQAWRNLMDQWQLAEMHIVGPAASQASLLRNQIYSFDTHPLDTCRTDRAVVLAEGDGFDIATRVFNSRGLDTLEYLLYNEDLAHTCTESNEQTDGWNARGETERKAARCAYAELLVEDIGDAASDIHDSWIASGGNYRQTFVNSDAPEVILETVSDALFYFEKITKDRKLGVPTGLHADCSAVACPESVESPFSQRSLQNIRINLDAFLGLFTGGEGVGFDDIIADADMQSVNTAFLAEIEDASNFVDSMIADELTLQVQAQAILDSGDGTDCANSQANPDTTQTVEACALQGYIKRITDRLRTDFITIVGVDLPDSAQGDSD